MSVLGVLAIGSAGAAISNFIFNYSKGEYEKAISRLEELVKSLDNHLTKLRELRANVPSFWDDDEAKTTCQALDMTIDRIVFDMDTCKSLISTYKTAMAEFDTSKNVTKELLKDAIGILSGLVG